MNQKTQPSNFQRVYDALISTKDNVCYSAVKTLHRTDFFGRGFRAEIPVGIFTEAEEQVLWDAIDQDLPEKLKKPTDIVYTLVSEK